MEVAKVIRKTLPLKADCETGSVKGGCSRLQATKNHVATLRADEGLSSDSEVPSTSSKGSRAHPKLCPKPQALVEKVMQERMAQKFKEEEVNKDKDQLVQDSVVTDVSSEEVLDVKNIKTESSPPLSDSSTEEKTSVEEKKTEDDTKSSVPNDKATSPLLSSSDTAAEVGLENKETSRVPDTSSNGRDVKHSGDKRPSHNSLSDTTTTSTDGNKPRRLNIRVVRHKSESSCPSQSNPKLRSTLSKQSSDISFDRGFHRGFTSSVDGPIIEGTDGNEEEEDECESGQSFRTRVARFARQKFHRATSLGSPQSPQATRGL